MRIRSRTRFRIVLALALIGPIAWIIASSKPGSGDWPRPPGMRGADTWVLVPNGDPSLIILFPNAKSETNHRYLRNSRTGDIIQINDEGHDKWEELPDGTSEYRKSEATLLRESEARGAWMMRTVIFFAGLVLSFFACYCAAWVGMFAVTRMIARERGLRSSMHT